MSDRSSSTSASSNDTQQESLCEPFDGISLRDRENDEVVSKGKPSRQKPNCSTCQSETKEKLKKMLEERQPLDYNVDIKTLDTPLHRFLDSPENHLKSSCEPLKQLNSMLTEVEKLGFLSAYINMPNKCGRTPLSLCLKNECLVQLISPLVRCGAQLHHLCGKLEERCNHLHYAMLKASPRVINATLDEVFRQDPFGADGMYALNKHHETPKASLQGRILEAVDHPHVLAELKRILSRIHGYSPVEGMSLRL